ncbi:SDR family oxidoreductase [Anaerococcus degeneri]|uniref:SDR family oxidoreductase n=1 Tax=Anaerococcus degeneri TaxID=361500 RepID=A0ABS7YX61_9FIRM|nr:SDR family oxidoreductase [Anaerococcus degeneri]MCA2096324.1 SDR family oxidoreductase [Anaerococcus degeneri]
MGREIAKEFAHEGAVDIAKACLFLASDNAKFINGAGLVVDGGVLAAE